MSQGLVSVNLPKNKAFLKRIRTMFADLKKGKKEVQASKMWDDLNEKGMQFVQQYGYENFKRTMVRQYFANTPLWMMNKQIIFLIFHINPFKTFSFFVKSLINSSYPPFSKIDAMGFTFITYLVWEYTKSVDTKKTLSKLSEPVMGIHLLFMIMIR